MATLTWVKCNGFVEHMAEKVHDLGSDAITIALSNTAPSAETPDPSVLTADCILANVTEIAYTNLSTRALSSITSSQTSGVETVDAANITLTASGGTVGPFRYIYKYNDTPTSPADPLIGYYDYGSSITMADGETLTFTFNASGILTVT
jgi:hypothetical protein